MEAATIGAVAAVAGAGLTAYAGIVVALRGKRTLDVTTLEVKHIDSSQALIERLSREIEQLHVRQDKQQAELDATREKLFAQQRVNLELENKIADNKRQLEGIQDTSRKHRQDSEETISRLTDEITALRSENARLRQAMADDQRPRTNDQ